LDNSIYIRKLEKSDLPRTLKWMNNSDIKKYININKPITEESQKEWFTSLYNSKNPSNVVFAIYLNSNKNHIGNVNLSMIDYDNRNARLAIFIADEDKRGRGYGTVAIEKVLEFGFGKLKLNKVYLKVDVKNLPAVRMYKKIGFKIEGILKKHDYSEDGFIDKYTLGILKSEFEKNQYSRDKVVSRETIPFNKIHIAGNEINNILNSLYSNKISGDGVYTSKCNKLLEEKFGVYKVLLTTSCSISLDMAAILFNIKDGEEVIMPSYSFPSLANSFLMRGAQIRFVDIKEETFNIDEEKIESAINRNTKAIAIVHYAGVSCNMEKIINIAKDHSLLVLEDAAQAINSKYKEKYLGTMGDLGTFSFHETKNIISGEGGALLINNEEYAERAEIIREKGTNRNKFFRGEIDKYTWVDIGSSFLPSEVIASFLYAQLEMLDDITEKRLDIWNYYYMNLEDLEKEGFLKRPVIPKDCSHNGHIFYILLRKNSIRDNLIKYLRNRNISSLFHFLPLHLSPMGQKLGYKKKDLPITENISGKILRLPFYYDLKRKDQDLVVNSIRNFFKNH